MRGDGRERGFGDGDLGNKPHLPFEVPLALVLELVNVVVVAVSSDEAGCRC